MLNSKYNSIAGKDSSRIIAISDGVFSVAMTLLVLEIKVPIQHAITSDTELMAALWALKPKFLVYFLAFMTTGIFWTGHSAQYKNIEKSDRNLGWINLMFLLSVTLLPFSTAFLGDYTQFKFPLLIYWFNIFLMGLMLYVNWWYAYKHGFINEQTRDIVDKPIRHRIIIAQSLYFLGALFCFVSTYLSISFIILIQLNYAFAFISGREK
ncbi:MAG: DUF1211 domain-containing protein [Bacteroidetes bacterium]|nr:DUF1211 domain-containing protein [Bacteroidota bacterium]MBS1740369.1 DUF1211 domain-containing protein [Bacteroidota bacterium]MBS1775224.1 DUF1211 domain-containing protein [Bacteroidota bacterium]